MFPILDVMNATLLTIAEAVTDITFLVVVFVIYMMYRRNNQFALYKLVNSNSTKAIKNVIEATLEGIFAGIFGSFIVVLLGLPLALSSILTLLLPIAIFLSLINTRYMCFSYSAALLGIIVLISNFLVYMGICTRGINIDPSGLIALVGVLHLIESVLIFLFGARNSTPIVIKQKGKIAVGFLMQKFWPLPFAILIMLVSLNTITHSGVQMPQWWPLLKPNIAGEITKFTFISIIAVLGYGDVAISQTPQKKTKKISIKLFGYSIFLIVISILSTHKIWLKIIGILLMPLLHEIIIVNDQLNEIREKAIYTLPSSGVRVINVIEGGPGDCIGIKSGDIIKTINGVKIRNYKHLKNILSSKERIYWIQVERINGDKVTLEHEINIEQACNLDIIHLPENPRVVYNLDLVKNTSVFKSFLKNKKT